MKILQKHSYESSDGFAIVWAIVVLVLIVIAATGLPLLLKTSKSPNPNACVTRNFGGGDTGQCVIDIQNMVNSKAFGIDGQLYIKATGSYDDATVSAVKTFQKNFNLPQNGAIHSKDWAELCKSSDDSPTYTSAAKDAGC
ncbi:MAG TPA: peptidoglycan-binding domain-containing protein [Candidatus Saccharimonadales bacterium]|nr:peptidoglycan-binding domain-containing protein [Candidatus Saccharimonadales bacterium]